MKFRRAVVFLLIPALHANGWAWVDFPTIAHKTGSWAIFTQQAVNPSLEFFHDPMSPASASAVQHAIAGQHPQKIPLCYFGRDGHALERLIDLVIESLDTEERCQVLILGGAQGRGGYDMIMTFVERLEERGWRNTVRLVISDIDPRLVAYAARGIFPTEQVLTPWAYRGQTDDLTPKELARRHRRFFREGEPGMSHFMPRQELVERFRIQPEFRTIDITNPAHLRQASDGENFNLILARNIPYFASNAKGILPRTSQDHVVWFLLGMLKPNGWVSLDYSLWNAAWEGLFSAIGCLALTENDVRVFLRFVQNHRLSPTLDISLGASALKLVRALAAEIQEALRPGAEPPTSSLTDIIDWLALTHDYCETAYFIQAALVFLTIDETILHYERDYILFWMVSQNKSESFGALLSALHFSAQMLTGLDALRAEDFLRRQLERYWPVSSRVDRVGSAA